MAVTGDPDLARLRRAARRRDRRRRTGNIGVAVGIAGLVLANLAVIGGSATGVTPGEGIARVDLVGIPLLGRGVAAGAPADGSDDAVDGGGSARGAATSSRDADAAGSSLPTWTGTAPPMGDDLSDAVSQDSPTATPPVGAEPTVMPTGTAAPTAPPTPSSTAPAPEPTAVPTATATQSAPAGSAKRVLDLVNAERVAAGCPALTADPQLAAAATAHAVDMVARQFFDHESPDGSTPADRATAAGYSGAVAENIATGYASAEAVVAGWMDSEGHRANILDCDQRVSGIGHDEGSLPGYAPGTWVQLFGTGG